MNSWEHNAATNLCEEPTLAGSYLLRYGALPPLGPWVSISTLKFLDALCDHEFMRAPTYRVHTLKRYGTLPTLGPLVSTLTLKFLSALCDHEFMRAPTQRVHTSKRYELSHLLWRSTSCRYPLLQGLTSLGRHLNHVSFAK